VDVLQELASHGFAVPRLILLHPRTAQAEVDLHRPLPQLVAADGRVHTSFNQAVAATGRLSSSDPNLQNIPIRTELGREIRKAFIAEEGMSAGGRLLAGRAAHPPRTSRQDCGLDRSLSRGADIHRATDRRSSTCRKTSSRMISGARGEDDQLRCAVRHVGFRLSNELNIPTGQAKDFIDAYFARYPKIQEYLDRTLEEARRSGKVTTLFGASLHPEIHNKSFRCAEPERMATNAPIQGTAADILKLAMIALDTRLDDASPMLLTVHDEIVIEVPEVRASEVAGIVKETMETIFPLAVPLKVDAHYGRSWYDAKA